MIAKLKLVETHEIAILLLCKRLKVKITLLFNRHTNPMVRYNEAVRWVGFKPQPSWLSPHWSCIETNAVQLVLEILFIKNTRYRLTCLLSLNAHFRFTMYPEVNATHINKPAEIVVALCLFACVWPTVNVSYGLMTQPHILRQHLRDMRLNLRDLRLYHVYFHHTTMSYIEIGNTWITMLLRSVISILLLLSTSNASNEQMEANICYGPCAKRFPAICMKHSLIADCIRIS